MSYGYPQWAWEVAKTEALEILRAVARRGVTIPYSDLASRLDAIRFEPDEHAFHHLLGELSEDEYGMITVLVVHKPPSDMRPGPGFFKLALQLGLDAEDQDQFWAEEFRRVVQANGGRA